MHSSPGQVSTIKPINRVMKLLTSSTVMAYLDHQKETEPITDASPVGLAAVLFKNTAVQNDCNVVAYVSRSL